MKKIVLYLLLLLHSSLGYANDKFNNLMLSHAQALKKGMDDREYFISSLRELANEGHKESQFMLGSHIFTGDIETEEALRWLLRAEAAGCSGASGILGKLFFFGKILEKDEARGFEYIKKAAKSGDEDSEVLLASMYLNGISPVKKDIVRAYSWFYQVDKSQIASLIQVKFMLSRLQKQLEKEDLDSAIELAHQRLETIGGIQTHYCASSMPIRK